MLFYPISFFNCNLFFVAGKYFIWANIKIVRKVIPNSPACIGNIMGFVHLHSTEALANVLSYLLRFYSIIQNNVMLLCKSRGLHSMIMYQFQVYLQHARSMHVQFNIAYCHMYSCTACNILCSSVTHFNWGGKPLQSFILIVVALVGTYMSTAYTLTKLTLTASKLEIVQNFTTLSYSMARHDIIYI